MDSSYLGPTVLLIADISWEIIDDSPAIITFYPAYDQARYTAGQGYISCAETQALYIFSLQKVRYDFSTGLPFIAAAFLKLISFL